VEALLEQARVRAEAEAAMEAAGVDAVLVPAVPRTAPRIGEELERGILLGFTRPFNTSGHPVITLPAPVPAGTLPVGIQVVGRFGRERELVAAALAVEASWR
jgi:Asp-tRNA(Asn)/Glu-tRNA(Gln) amidotransferase A subunit family amidase